MYSCRSRNFQWPRVKYKLPSRYDESFYLRGSSYTQEQLGYKFSQLHYGNPFSTLVYYHESRHYLYSVILHHHQTLAVSAQASLLHQQPTFIPLTLMRRRLRSGVSELIGLLVGQFRLGHNMNSSGNSEVLGYVELPFLHDILFHPHLVGLN
jgi:hypothetical protein